MNINDITAFGERINNFVTTVRIDKKRDNEGRGSTHVKNCVKLFKDDLPLF